MNGRNLAIFVDPYPALKVWLQYFPVVQAEFVKSAVSERDFLCEAIPEVVFAGRSNVGKSSLINTLVNRKHLVKTSSTPGRTQLINFFLINESLSFVDLPGYGYARVPAAVKKKWGPMIEGYLQKRTSLQAVTLIMDIRRTPKAEERNFIDWLHMYHIPVIPVLTKADKLKKGPANNSLLSVRKHLAEHGDLITVQLFSALKHSGHERLIDVLNSWLTDVSVIEDESTL